MTRRRIIALVVFVAVLCLWLWMLSTPRQLSAAKVPYTLSASFDRGVQGCLVFNATGTMQVDRSRGVARHRLSRARLVDPMLRVSLRPQCDQGKRSANTLVLTQYWYDPSCKADVLKSLRAKPFQTPDCGRHSAAYLTTSYPKGWRFMQVNSGVFATWDTSKTWFSGQSAKRLCLRGAAAVRVQYHGSFYQVVTDLGKVCA